MKTSFAAALTERFVTSKLTLLFMLSCMIFGLFSLFNTPREDNPQIVIPGASIVVNLPGASAAEVEKLVVRPLEGAIRQIPGVDKFYSTSVTNQARLSVQFDVGLDEEKTLVSLQDRINAARPLLPPDTGTPLIRSLNVDDVPIVTVTLASEQYDDFALKRIADHMMDGLRGMKNVSAVYVKGGRNRELRVELNPDRMQAFGITLDQLHAQLAAANISATLGDVVQQQKNRQVFLDGDLSSSEDLRKLVVGLHQQHPIYLEDIARVVDGAVDERDTVSRFGFGPADARFGQSRDPDMPAVTLAIAKRRGTNAVNVAQQVLQKVEEMHRAFVPAGINVVTTRNDGQVADDTVNELIQHLGIAIVSVFLVTLLFLGRKEALIVGMSVPLVLALTLGMLYMFGFTINRVSLFGLILTLGLLVDDAIVVIENIHRHYRNTVGDKRAETVEATREVGNPTNLATVAVMLVFGSLVVVTGMSGEYFLPIAFTVPVAMGASLLIAYTVVPWAANRWLPVATHNNGSQEHAGPTGIALRYYHWMKAMLNHRGKRRLLLLLVIVMIACSLLQPLWQFIRPQGLSGPQSFFGVDTTMMPSLDKTTFNITLDMPETTPIEVTDQVARKLATLLRTQPEVANYQIWLGQSGVMDFNGMLRGYAEKSGPYVAEIRVNLNGVHQRKTTSMAVVRELRPKMQAVVAKYPGAVVQLVEAAPGPPVRATVLAEIYGSKEPVLRQLSSEVTKQFNNTWDMVEVNNSEPADVVQYRLQVDREKAALSGLTQAEVLTTLRRLIEGEYLGRMHVAGEENPVPVRLVIPRRHQLDVTRLTRAYVTNSQGAKVPLSELVRMVKSTADRPILHKNGQRVTYVYGEMGNTASVYAVLDMNRRLQGMPVVDGTTLQTGNLGLQQQEPDTLSHYTLLWDGEVRQMLDTYRDMLWAFLLSILAIYLILVAYYQSFSLPMIAMAAIPLGLVGVFPGHWILHAQFSASSMIGVIALAGVVIRNSLLIIDFVLENQRRGLDLQQAILDAGVVRMRPIMLTALAIALGSSVMLQDALFGGLAISLIFGTVAATVLTLLVVPLLLYRLLRWKQARQAKADTEGSGQELAKLS